MLDRGLWELIFFFVDSQLQAMKRFQEQQKAMKAMEGKKKKK